MLRLARLYRTGRFACWLGAVDWRAVRKQPVCCPEHPCRVDILGDRDFDRVSFRLVATDEQGAETSHLRSRVLRL
jgi:hypothetical protein